MKSINQIVEYGHFIKENDIKIRKRILNFKRQYTRQKWAHNNPIAFQI
ncbi:hypothetical protein ACW6QP_15035 [Salegentibacter sp. HM20]